MTRFFFTRRFNRFDILCLGLAILLGEQHRLGLGIGLLVIGALFSAAGETALHNRGLK